MTYDTTIDTYFGGDAALFDAFRSASMAQLTHDLRAGDLAANTRDFPVLGRTTHTLKSVMLLLGLPEASKMAAECEDACEHGLHVQALASWEQLAGRLSAMISSDEKSS